MKCLILGGGKSKRFGEDKLLYEFKGKKVVERVVEAAKEVCKEVFIVTKNPQKFEFLKIPILLDLSNVYASMVGLYTALSYAKEPALVLSGDLPLINSGVLEKLLSSYEEPITLAKTKDRIHPLVAVYSPKVLKVVEEFLEKENYKLYELVNKVGFKAVEFEDKEALSLLNLNTKEDLKILENLEIN